MSDFNPGDGWHPVDISEENNAVYELAQYGDNGELVAAWNREAPVPPLPTEPYTVIRVTWKDSAKKAVLTLGDNALWLVHANITNYRNATQVAAEITGFEVLAEPRAAITAEFLEKGLVEVRRETAKAVLDRVRSLALTDRSEYRLHELAREFGVSS